MAWSHVARRLVALSTPFVLVLTSCSGDGGGDAGGVGGHSGGAGGEGGGAGGEGGGAGGEGGGAGGEGGGGSAGTSQTGDAGSAGAPVAEPSVTDLVELEMSPTLASDIVPVSELTSYCASSEDTFGVGVLTNEATGFTRYHYFACYEGQKELNQNHFTQLLRDSYPTLQDFPDGASTYAGAFSIGERVFFMTGSNCWNCSYEFGGRTTTLLTVADAGLVDGTYQATIMDNAGATATVTLTLVTP